jgi:hypothetical protein
MRITTFLALLGLVVWSCDSHTTTEPEAKDAMEVDFEFLDSVLVESLGELSLGAVNPATGQMIFKDRFLNQFLLTDKIGNILDTLSIKGDGPDQVGFPMEMAFVGDGLVVKDMSAEMPLNFFGPDFRKEKIGKPIAKGMNLLEINRTHVSFSPFQVGGRTLIVGTEANAIEPQLMAPESQNADFYGLAESGYVYDPAKDSLWRFNAYPENWLPRKYRQWKGQALPYASALGESGLIGILPRVGNQLFFFRWENELLVPAGEASLVHAERNETLEIDPMDQPFLYPLFSDLKGGGKFFLVEFHTEIPKKVRDEFRVKSENYINDPGFKEVFRKYRKAKYLLVDSQGGSLAIAELPIAGAVHYFDKKDILYIKPEREEEQNYNVFYRYKVK